MNNYITKNILLFISVVIISIVMVGMVQLYSFDNRLIKEKITQLKSINQSFYLELNKNIKNNFSFINFLAKTSYPNVALDFGMHQQFYDIVEGMSVDTDLLGIYLFDSNGNFLSKKFFGDKPLDSKIEKLKDLHEQIIFQDGNIFFITPFYTDNSLSGFICGVKHNSIIRKSLEAAYYGAVANFIDLKPKINIIWDEAFPSLTVPKFYYAVPKTFLYGFNKNNLLFIFTSSVIILFFFSFILRRSLSKPILEIHNIISAVAKSEEKIIKDLPVPNDSLFKKIATAILDMNEHRNLLERKDREREIISHIAQTASQVAHDIRSPLTALNLVTQHLKDLPEDQRLLIRSAVQRIEDITNDLAGKRDQFSENTKDQEKIKVHLLSSLIEPLISEKRVQFRSRREINIESDLGAKSYGLFGKIQPVQFKRVLSNLINNSVEAIGENGLVKVSLVSDDGDVKTIISDNGNGIPKDILPKLMQKGVSFGKESSKESGSGLGLHHARESVESWGGKIKIESEVGKGTLVTVNLPRASSPDWFVPVIEVTEDMHVVILDDDNSIHQVWQGRFDAMNLNKDRIFHFTSPHAIVSWYNENRHSKKSYLFLCDYELLGNKENGLDVIEQLGIGSSSILVTSRFEEEPVKANCERLGVKLLPKNLAGFVPIVLDSRDDKRSDAEYVLIDDSKINCDNWRLMGKFYNKKVCTFNSPGEFYAMIDQFDRATNIYIDSNLSDDIQGETVAKDIFERGFNKIYLCTGHSKEDFPNMPWIKDIVGKTPPFINRSKFQA